MKAKPMRFWFSIGMAIIFIGALLAPVTVFADETPDQLESYTISVTPQMDGSLLMDYKLENYCVAIEKWPSDEPYLQIGVPNGNFTIGEWGPKEGANRVVNAEALTLGSSFVQLDFDEGSLPKRGDCFDLFFSIVQNKMAYPDPENGNITFKFIPAGWKFPIQVKSLTLNWAAPIDPGLVKLTDPAPMAVVSTTMIWQWDNPLMDASGMFSDASVKFAYDKSAFTLSEAATTNTDSGNGGNSSDLGLICLWTIVVIVVLIIVLWIFLALIEFVSSGDSLGTSFVTVASNVSDVLSDGGGFGGSSGHSSGCACAGCACACACAGGGRVGCSRKGIGIQCLDDTIKKMTKEEECE